MPLSFAADILPLFRDEPDIVAMKRYGLNLSSHGEVKEKAKEIYATLEDCSIRATTLDRRTMWRCSSAGWMKAWPPKHA